jgi:hypothetical protein
LPTAAYPVDGAIGLHITSSLIRDYLWPSSNIFWAVRNIRFV